MALSRFGAACCLVSLAAAGGIAQSPSLISDTIPHKEVLDYAIEWRLVPAGEAKFTWTSLSNSPLGASEVRLHLESKGLVSRLFRVEDDYTAMMGPDFCVMNTFLAAHEGSRNHETRVTYDPQRHQADYLEKDVTKNTTITHQVEIPSCVHDVIGALMVLRSLRLDPGKTAMIPVSDGKKFVQVKVESQTREPLKTNFGTLNTIRYEAFVFNNVLFKRAGHLHIWMTDDDRRLPVQLQIRLQFTIGTITLRLDKDDKS